MDKLWTDELPTAYPQPAHSFISVPVIHKLHSLYDDYATASYISFIEKLKIISLVNNNDYYD